MAEPDRVTTFVEAALPPDGHHRAGDARAALSLLAEDPSLANADFYSACLCGNGDAVARALTVGPGLAVRSGGPRGWAPLLYVTFSRLLRGCPEREDGFVRVAEAMLRQGADAPSS